MNRYFTPREPVVPRRPKRIELPESSRKWIIMTLGLVLAASMVFLAVYFMSFLPGGEGWRQIETPHSATGCQTQYVFQYNLGKNGDATAQNKAVSALYTQATDEAWRALSNTAYEGVNNLYLLNRSLNEAVPVDPILYWALEQIGDSRILFRAPLFSYYNGLYHCGNDVNAAALDPTQNAEAANYVSSLAAFSESPEDISVELLGAGKVMVHVSRRYLDFARENELESLLDFGWLRNALVLDHTAGLLTQRGYTDGTISSFDGFTRSLGNEAYSVNLYGAADGQSRQAAGVHFEGPMAQVCFRSMPLYELDEGSYYSYEDGRVCGPYVGSDGLLRSGCDSLLLLSRTLGCTELALGGLSVYTAADFAEDALSGMNWVAVHRTDVHQGGSGFTVEAYQ